MKLIKPSQEHKLLIRNCKISIVLISLASVISHCILAPRSLDEVDRIRSGDLTLKSEYRFEESTRTEEFESQVAGLRENSAQEIFILFVVGSSVSIASSLMAILGALLGSYCLTFLPCLAFLVPIGCQCAVMRLINLQWLKILLLSFNVINCIQTYTFSFLIKHYEFEDLMLER